MLVHRTCSTCGASFARPAWQARKSPDARCSQACGYASRSAARPFPMVIEGDVARIPLLGRDGSVRAYALIDAADAPWASQWKWFLGPHNGVIRNRDDRDGSGTTKSPALHRELLGLKKADNVEVDHISRDRLDNRRANLKIEPKHTHSQNVPSMRGAISRYRGVTFKKATGKWVAQIHANGKMRHLGTFTSEEDAAECAREARKRLLPYAVD